MTINYVLYTTVIVNVMLLCTMTYIGQCNYSTIITLIQYYISNQNDKF